MVRSSSNHYKSDQGEPARIKYSVKDVEIKLRGEIGGDASGVRKVVAPRQLHAPPQLPAPAVSYSVGSISSGDYRSKVEGGNGSGQIDLAAKSLYAC
jgi:hypothetical protein